MYKNYGQPLQFMISCWKLAIKYQKTSQYSEILFGDPILCFNRFCSNLISDCLLITIYLDENILLENFMSLLGHVYLRRVKDNHRKFKDNHKKVFINFSKTFNYISRSTLVNLINYRFKKCSCCYSIHILRDKFSLYSGKIFKYKKCLFSDNYCKSNFNEVFSILLFMNDWILKNDGSFSSIF